MNSVECEYDLILRLVQGFSRPEGQLNALGESDAELLPLGNGSVLAATTDTIAEEIASGLFSPWLAGWMSVIASCSDLAAVGAEPIALLIAETLGSSMNAGEVEELQCGIADGAAACSVGIAGGDTNRGRQTSLTCTALGICSAGARLTRRGAGCGDILYMSSQAGTGSAYAISRLYGSSNICYMPQAALREGRMLAGFASSCMDSSDGLIATLDELGRVNFCGFDIDMAIEELLHESAMSAAGLLGLEPWTMLCGPLGDYGLVFTIPQACNEDFLNVAHANAWDPLRLGLVSTANGVRLHGQLRIRNIDTRRLCAEINACESPEEYLGLYMNYSQQFTPESVS